MSVSPAAVAALFVSALATAAQAQQSVELGAATPASDAPQPATTEPDMDDAADIVVTAGAQRGAVVGDIQPELQLNAADIRAYGAGSINELLQQLSPQTTSGRGRDGGMPVALINGKRISGFAEIRNIPPEAIERVDILPEEAAIAYGYRADQRVVNFVLRQRFNAVTSELEVGGATAGGRRDYELEGNIFRVSGDSRLLIDVQVEHATRLLESQRDIIPTPSSQPWSIAGNIVSPVDGAEIDPALSALAGEPVTVAGVPASAATSEPTLNAFVPGANNPNPSDDARFRTLLPETSEVSIGTSLTRPIGKSVQATLSARFGATSSESRLGLATGSLLLPSANPYSPFGTDVTLLRSADAPGPLIRDAKGWTGRLAAAFNGEVFTGWRWTVTASHDHADSRTLTDRSLDLSDVQARILALDPAFNPFGENAINGPVNQDRVTSNNDVTELNAVLNGKIFEIPAGRVSTTVKVGAVRRDLEGESRRNAIVIPRDLERDEGRASLSIDIPLTSRRNDVLAALGDLSLNLNVEGEKFSDFGNLVTWGGGATWRPITQMQIMASFTSEDGAPSISQLGDPLQTTPNVRVFDYVQGETVEITRIDGGNADLSADRRRVLKLGGRVTPIAETDFSIQADYVDTRITGPISGFPTATAEIEAAFPQRFIRDADGRLLQIDNRPINFQESNRRELRWGVNFSEKLEPSKAERAAAEKRRAEFAEKRKAAAAAGQPVPAPGGAPQDAPPSGTRPQGEGPPLGSGGGPRFGGPGGPGGRMNPGEGRLQFSLFHTFRLEDTILIRDGVPELDRLNGSATGSTGGVPRHLVEVRTGINKNGLGARLSFNWQSGTKVLVDPSGPSSPDDLRFSDLTTVGLRIFADLGQRPGIAMKHPWLRGARISFGIDNIFDDKLDVTNRAGDTPINYQPDLIDPVGRRVELSFRKVFF